MNSSRRKGAVDQMSNRTNRKSKRGIFNGASYALHWLFCVPDASDAKLYEESQVKITFCIREWLPYQKLHKYSLELTLVDNLRFPYHLRFQGAAKFLSPVNLDIWKDANVRREDPAGRFCSVNPRETLPLPVRHDSSSYPHPLARTSLANFRMCDLRELTTGMQRTRHRHVYLRWYLPGNYLLCLDLRYPV